MNLRQLKQLCDERDHLEAFSKLLKKPDLKLSRTFRSPIRMDDDHGSFNVYRNGAGRVVFKDFAYESGDIYSLVQILHGVDFKRSVEIVASLLDVTSTDVPRQITDQMMIRAMAAKVLRVDRSPLQVTYDTLLIHWQHSRYLMYWDKYSVGVVTLSERGIRICNKMTMHRSNELVFEFNATKNGPDSLAFVIKIGDHVKLYRPLQEHRQRYIGNTDRNDVFGIDRLDSETVSVIITAGQKDAIVLEELLANPFYRTIAFNSESTIPDQKIMRSLIGHYNLYVLYDRDNAGLVGMEKLIKAYPSIKPIHLQPLVTYPNVQLKDVSDYVEHGFRDSLLKTVYAAMVPKIPKR